MSDLECGCESCAKMRFESSACRPEGLAAQPWLFATRRRPEHFVRSTTPIMASKGLTVDGFIKTTYAGVHDPDYNPGRPYLKRRK